MRGITVAIGAWLSGALSDLGATAGDDRREPDPEFTAPAPAPAVDDRGVPAGSH
ncbi:hypothetical protein [Streptomyces tubercidicus]|uniref:hypothetical protein n=1 Tax=Streptomyces tubercidicus TaxID=47759 RepID=UPI003683B146